MINPQESHIFYKEVLNEHMTTNYVANREKSDESLEKPKMKEHFNNGKLLDVNNVSDTSKEVQIIDNYGGDGLKLETIEKKFEGLKIENELIADKAQLINNEYKFKNDQITMVKDQTNKVQNEIEKIHYMKIKNELENVMCLKTVVDKMVAIHSHVDQFEMTVNGLETAVEEACENKKIMTEIMEVSEYMKNQYYFQMAENQRHFAEQIGKNLGEIDQLKTDADIKAIELNELEKRFAEQQLCVGLHQESMKRVEKYIADMLSIIDSYLKQLESENNQLAIPNDNQKETVLLLAKQLEEIYGIISNEKSAKHDE